MSKISHVLKTRESFWRTLHERKRHFCAHYQPPLSSNHRVLPSATAREPRQFFDILSIGKNLENPPLKGSMRHPPLTLKSLNKCLRLLGLPPPPPPGGSGEQLTQSIVKASYNKMALRYHPDNKKEGDDKKFKNITEARDLLLNHFEQNRHREDVFRRWGV